MKLVVTLTTAAAFQMQQSTDTSHTEGSGCETQALAKCGTNVPCIDLRQDSNHHHLMWLHGDGTAHVDGEASGYNDNRAWTCTCSGSCSGLVGVWSCPGFYNGVITITSDYADDFTSSVATDHVDVCSLASGTVQSFSYTSADQTFVVPSGVSSVSVELWGAGGGGGEHGNCAGRHNGDSAGGGGGYTQGTLAVTPGETLTIVVGGGGQAGKGIASAYGGGGRVGSGSYCAGGRGGRSAIRRGSSD